MKTQFGNQQLINLASVKRNGLGVVAAVGYGVVSSIDCPASERLSPDCRASGSALRALRPQLPPRSSMSPSASWQGATPSVPTTVVPGVANVTVVKPVDIRLPAPAWAAFVLNHALCG